MIDKSTAFALVLATVAAGAGAYVIYVMLGLGLAAAVFWAVFLYGTVGVSLVLFGDGGGSTTDTVTPDAYASKGARIEAEADEETGE